MLGLQQGASPRGRSSQPRGAGVARGLRRISARAEQPISGRRSRLRRGAHLRAGGAACANHEAGRPRTGASPRGRSSRRPRLRLQRLDGRISARAEQPSRSSTRTRGWRAHLRAGGAANRERSHHASPKGASPRGRSSLHREELAQRLRGRISARAEQPVRARRMRSPTAAHLRAGGAASVTGSRGYYQAGSPLLPAFPYSAVNEQPKRERLGRRSRAS